MAKGNGIIVSGSPRGVQKAGYINGALKPGIVVQRDVSEAAVGGLFTYEAYAPGTDGNRRPISVLLHDEKQGKLATAAYVDGDYCEIYYPLPGEELNMLFQNQAGTADDIAVGDLFIVDNSTGKMLATTGSPESEPFEALEAVTDPTADQLVWMMYTGY